MRYLEKIGIPSAAVRMAACWLTAVASLPAAGPVDVTKDFQVPDGFEVTLFAGDELAHDIGCMAIDSQGRVVVAGPGYIKTLMDRDGDGAADDAALFSSKPKSGAQGLCFVESTPNPHPTERWTGNDLLASGDGKIWRFHDADGDGIADGEPEIFVDGLSNKGEHGIHGIAQGPDGWIYAVGGNDSGIAVRHNTSATFLIPEVSAGAILRVSPDGRQREVVAHGFRNPYAICFNASGSLFCWDSDGERIQFLPYYRPCSVFKVGFGGHHGWVNPGWQGGWSRPFHWPDVVDPVMQIGRGSPTGIVCYRHRQFPAEYEDALFFACWTFGRIYWARPGADDDRRMEHQVFLEASGNLGFAPTALAVGPGGELFVSSGGRGTRGNVYRIRHKTHEIHGDPDAEIEEILDCDQPDAAWSRARWVPLARKLGRNGIQNFEHSRLESLSPAHRKRLAWVMDEALCGDSASKPLAKRKVAINPAPDWASVDWASADDATVMNALRAVQLRGGDVVCDSKGGAWEDGFRLARPDKITSDIAAAFPGIAARRNSILHLEYARLIAMTGAEPTGFWEWLAKQWSEASMVESDIHFLLVAASRRRPHGNLGVIADAWLGLHHKMRRLGQAPSRFWPEMVGNAFAAMLEKNPGLAEAVLKSTAFNLPEQTMFAARLNEGTRAEAARILASRTLDWSGELVAMLGEGTSDDTLLEMLRKKWTDAGLRDAISLVLAKAAREADRDKLLEGLHSMQANVVAACARAIGEIDKKSTGGRSADAGELLSVFRAMRRFESRLDAVEASKELAKLLAILSAPHGFAARSIARGGASDTAWIRDCEEWFRNKFPEQARALDVGAGMDLTKERQRWAAIVWSKGDAAHGKSIFEQRLCARCHGGQGTSRLGPDLKGVTKRWSPEDLMLQIADPNRQISPTWDAEMFVLRDGRQLVGKMIYDSPAGMLIQTSPDETVRVIGGELKERKKSEVSVMPAALLSGLADEDLAALWAFMAKL